ncbi:hypothetical protein ASNO1_73930 [Corallococcus caeni]|uniref:Uncharacterized protein n=1 Tax=Corallococcus caeni TaxID=3082388 RepID=A0ABQ6R498_9BACT|nr:hypothetical protein ASNO1_73930 [Corallococcus sp. NO1]
MRTLGSPSEDVAASAAGVRLTTLNSCSRSSTGRGAPGINFSSGASTNVAPLQSVVKTSSTDKSKLRLANCNTRLPGPMP